MRVVPAVSRSASRRQSAQGGRLRGSRPRHLGPRHEVGDAFGQPPRCVHRGVGPGGVVKKLVAQHDSQVVVAHGGGAGREHDAFAGGRGGDVGSAAGQCAELLVGRGGHDDDVAGPVGAPECRHGACGVVHLPGDAVQQRLRFRAAQTHRRNRAAIGECGGAGGLRGRGRRRGGSGRGRRRDGPADERHREDELDDQQQAQQWTFSTGGRCRSGHCSPAQLAPACRRWTRAPSSRRRCRSQNATRRSSS